MANHASVAVVLMGQVSTAAAARVPRRRPTLRGLLPERGPRRILAYSSFVNTVGTGLFLTSSALFFTRSVGLSTTRVGAGLAIGGLTGLVAGIGIGHVADRRSPRTVLIATLSAEAAAMAAFTLVHSFWAFVAVVTVAEIAASASAAARGPIVRAIGGQNPAPLRAYLYAITNVGLTLGSLGAGVAVQIDSRAAYLTLVLGNALSFVLCAVVVARLPHLTPAATTAPAGAAHAGGRWLALRDRPYFAVTALNGVMAVLYPVTTFAIPLWIVGHTRAPRAIVAVTFLINTLSVVALQVRMSRGVDSPSAAGRAARRAGFILAAGFVMTALAADLPGPAAALLLAGAAAVIVVGEIWHAAASFELSFALAAPHAQGQYTGVFNIGQGLSQAMAPFILGLVCLTWGVPGWLALGGIVTAAGLTMPAVARWGMCSAR